MTNLNDHLQLVNVLDEGRLRCDTRLILVPQLTDLLGCSQSDIQSSQSGSVGSVRQSARQLLQSATHANFLPFDCIIYYSHAGQTLLVTNIVGRTSTDVANGSHADAEESQQSRTHSCVSPQHVLNLHNGSSLTLCLLLIRDLAQHITVQTQKLLYTGEGLLQMSGICRVSHHTCTSCRATALFYCRVSFAASPDLYIVQPSTTVHKIWTSPSLWTHLAVGCDVTHN